jgi:hypothetical protein
LLHEAQGKILNIQSIRWMHNLRTIVDYLAPQVKAMNISENRFKYLSFQVGANDVCQLCAAGEQGQFTDLTC